MLPQDQIPRADHNIALTITAGMERMARAVKDSADRALLIIELVNKAPVAGRIDLSTGTYANILIDTLRLEGAINTHAPSSATFKNTPTSLDALKAKMPVDPDCVWYLLRGKQLIFRNPVDGELNTYTTALDLAVSYIPILGDATLVMPQELDDQLISSVSDIVKGLGGMQFLKADPEVAAVQAQGA